MNALKLELRFIVVGVDTDSWHILIYFHKYGSYRVSLDFFKSRSPSELWIMLHKVRRSSEMNEILRDYIMQFARESSPEIVSNPNDIRYVKDSKYQLFHLNNLTGYSLKNLISIETMLRKEGFAQKAKSNVSDHIEAYCLSKNIPFHNKWKSETTFKQPSEIPYDPLEAEVLWEINRGNMRRLDGNLTKEEEPRLERLPTPVIGRGGEEGDQNQDK